MVFHFIAGKIILVNWKKWHVLFWTCLIIPLYNQNRNLDCQSSMELLLSCPPPSKSCRIKIFCGLMFHVFRFHKTTVKKLACYPRIQTITAKKSLKIRLVLPLIIQIFPKTAFKRNIWFSRSWRLWNHWYSLLCGNHTYFHDLWVYAARCCTSLAFICPWIYR